MGAYQGDTFSRTITLKQNNGAPVDLTGMGVRFSLAVARNAKPAFTYEGTVTVPAMGEVGLSVPDTETSKWNAGKYFYDVAVTDGQGYTRTFLTGQIGVERRAVV